jgi:hypothetical protein
MRCQLIGGPLTVQHNSPWQRIPSYSRCHPLGQFNDSPMLRDRVFIVFFPAGEGLGDVAQHRPCLAALSPVMKALCGIEAIRVTNFIGGEHGAE